LLTCHYKYVDPKVVPTPFSIKFLRLLIISPGPCHFNESQKIGQEMD